MRALKLFPFAFLLCAACSPDPTGLYKNQTGREYFDFRLDKTAKFTSWMTGQAYTGHGVEDLRTGKGGGTWSIRDGKLLFEGKRISQSPTPCGPAITNTNDLRVEFSFENNGDLITVPGDYYKERVRFIKQ